MSTGREIAAVAVGGAVGTGIRLGLDLLIPHDANSFPVSTLIINTLGAFALGMIVARLWPIAPAWLRAGLLGSFTTFSALAVSLVSLGSSSQWMLALGYLVATLALGLTAAWLGLRTGRPAGEFDGVDE